MKIWENLKVPLTVVLVLLVIALLLALTANALVYYQENGMLPVEVTFKMMHKGDL